MRRDRATPPTVRERRDGAGAHCVVPQGQFSKVFGLAPQIVQVSRSFRAFARAFLASYSFCFSTYSAFICLERGVDGVNSYAHDAAVSGWARSRRRAQRAAEAKSTSG